MAMDYWQKKAIIEGLTEQMREDINDNTKSRFKLDTKTLISGNSEDRFSSKDVHTAYAEVMSMAEQEQSYSKKKSLEVAAYALAYYQYNKDIKHSL